MIPSTQSLLALRYRVTDGALMDWASLASLVDPPCQIDTNFLRAHWGCGHSGVCRRLARLAAHGLLDYSAGQGAYHIHHLGPITKCDSGPS